MEVETCHHLSLSSTASLSFPQRGYCSLRCNTAKTSRLLKKGFYGRETTW